LIGQYDRHAHRFDGLTISATRSSFELMTTLAACAARVDPQADTVLSLTN